MAEFNDWEPVLGPVAGIMQQEPRVFGHDAIGITAQGIHANGFTITNGGSGFDSSDVGDTIAQSGASVPSGGTGVSFNITQVTGDAVTGLQLTSSLTGGTAYTAGMVITLAAASSGGSGCQITVSAFGSNIPNTRRRGAVIYNGKSSAQDITITTEAGNDVEFKSVPSGTTLGDKSPVLATVLKTGTDCVAIY